MPTETVLSAVQCTLHNPSRQWNTMSRLGSALLHAVGLPQTWRPALGAVLCDFLLPASEGLLSVAATLHGGSRSCVEATGLNIVDPATGLSCTGEQFLSLVYATLFQAKQTYLQRLSLHAPSVYWNVL